jgi:hypothetical protein
LENGYLHFCPRCGRQDLDRESHGSPGTALCNACGTLFSIMSVRFGEKMVPIEKAAKVASGTGPVPEEPSTETTLPVPDEATAEDARENTLRITKKPASSS